MLDFVGPVAEKRQTGATQLKQCHYFVLFSLTFGLLGVCFTALSTHYVALADQVSGENS